MAAAMMAGCWFLAKYSTIAPKARYHSMYLAQTGFPPPDKVVISWGNTNTWVRYLAGSVEYLR